MTTSYNGWPASTVPSSIGIAPLSPAGVVLVGGVKSGDVATVLGYVAQQLHVRVEKGVNPGCWGYSYRKNRNANNLSCHASGTAFDWNAPLHPNGKHGTFTSGQVLTIRKILAEVDGTVRWGGDFTGTKDEMHFEIKVSTTVLVPVAARIRTASAITKEAIMSAVNEYIPDGNHYSGKPETLGWLLRELEPRIVGQVLPALAASEARILAAVHDLPRLTANEILNRVLTAQTWNGGDVADRQATVAQLLTRASEGSIAAHLAQGEKLVGEHEEPGAAA